MRKYKIANIVGLILLLVSAFQVLGLKSFFAGCAKRENGTWMNCRWASQAVIGVSFLLIILAVLLILVRSTNTKKGIAIAIIPTSLLNLLLPDILIPLCSSAKMRCHTTMLPAVRVLSLIIAGIALLEVLGLLFAGRRERKLAMSGAAAEEKEAKLEAPEAVQALEDKAAETADAAAEAAQDGGAAKDAAERS